MARKPTGRRSKGRIPTGRRAPTMEGQRLITPTLDWESPPVQVQLPSIANLVNLTVEQRYDTLQQFGLMRTWDEARAESATYVSRLTSFQAGTPAFDAEVENLISVNSKRGLLRNLRGAYRQFNIIDSLEGLDPRTAEFVRLVEADGNSCEGCLALTGEEGTMAYHQSIGMPGPASCLGECRCDLINVT